MQQDSKTTQELLLKNIKCKCNSQAILICTSKNCKFSSFVCGLLTCNHMAQKHKFCQFTIAPALLQKVFKKKRNLNQSCQKAFNVLIKIYQDIIDQLSLDKENLMSWKEHFGLTEKQRELIDMIEQNRLEQIIGNLTNRIRSQVDTQFLNLKDFTQGKIISFWQGQKNKFKQLRFSILSKYNKYSTKPFQPLECLNQLTFDQKNSPKKMKYQDNCVTYTGQYSYQFSFLNEASFDCKSHFYWGFKIHNLTNWLAVGMGQKKALIKKGYTWQNIGSLGHGGYLLSYNAYSWNSTKIEQNQKSQGFTYQNNDIIYCCYNPNELKLTFILNKNVQRHELNLCNVDQENPLVPCVLFYGKESKVQLIQIDPQVVW